MAGFTIQELQKFEAVAVSELNRVKDDPRKWAERQAQEITLNRIRAGIARVAAGKEGGA